MGGVNAEQQLTTPSRLTERMQAHSSAVMSANEPVMPIPALFTSTLRGAVPILHGGGQGIDLRPIGHVEPVGGVPVPADRACALAALGRRLLGRRLVDVGAQHGGPAGCQRMGGGPADPAARARSQGPWHLRG